MTFPTTSHRDALPHVDPVPGVSSLYENRGVLIASVLKRTFTPIIGAECSVIGRKETAGWHAIANDLAHLLRDKGLTRTEEQNYLESLRDIKEVSQEGSRPPEPREESEALHAFRVQLVKLAAKATVAFGNAMRESVRPVEEACTYNLRLIKGDLAEIGELLILACAVARKLAVPGANLTLFDADSVFERMAELTVKLTKRRLPPDRMRRLLDRQDVPGVREVLTRLGIREGSPALSDEENPPVLYVDQLGWLADLLWYTFRFDAPAYPTNAELAFQVSLDIRESDRRPDLVSAAEVHSADRVTKQLRTWFQTYAQGMSSEDMELETHHEGIRSLADFYKAIALYLLEQYRGSVSPIRAEEAKEAVAFSTTFDMELEKALADCRPRQTFHVVIPVEALTVGPSREVHIRWLLGTIGVNDAIERPHWEWWPQDDPASSPLQIRGPVLIKAHGSPLHVLPEPGEDGYKRLFLAYRELHHALTLSESDYLQKIVLVDNMPRFFDDVLQDEERTVCFLGHPISEWNVKLRIQDLRFPGKDFSKGSPVEGPPKSESPRTRKKGRQGRRAGSAVRPAAQRFVAINSSFDPYLSHVLGAFGVHRWHGKLEEVTGIVREALELET